jgi:hypothetical protein
MQPAILKWIGLVIGQSSEDQCGLSVPYRKCLGPERNVSDLGDFVCVCVCVCFGIFAIHSEMF